MHADILPETVTLPPDGSLGRHLPDERGRRPQRTQIEILDHDFLLGQSLMDAEHADLIAGLRRLLSAESDEAAAHAITGFVQLWRDHCADEETLMEEIGYQSLEAHRESHRAFDGMLLYHLNEFLRQRRWGSHEMAVFVSRWFLGHLNSHDRPLADFIATRIV